VVFQRSTWFSRIRGGVPEGPTARNLGSLGMPAIMPDLEAARGKYRLGVRLGQYALRCMSAALHIIAFS
jgi:hypothetical protein